MKILSRPLRHTLVFYGILTTLLLLWWLLPAPILITNAHIISMDEHQVYGDAILVNGGKIAAIGTSEQLLSDKPARTRVYDLQGKTLLPGFIDAHSHFPASHITHLGFDFSSPPLGDIKNIKQLQSALKDANAALSSNKKWLIGFNYDDAWLTERRHPTRDEIDKAIPNRATIIYNRSGHLAVLNTKGLIELKVLPQDALNNPHLYTHNGLLKESELPEKIALLKTQTSLFRVIGMLKQAKNDYLANGVTSVQNGHSSKLMAWALATSHALGWIPQHIVIWPAHEQRLANNGFHLKHYPGSADSFSTGAIKIIVDGSPQGQTAWLTQAYLPVNQSEATKKEPNHGIALFSQQELNKVVAGYHRNGYQLALHGNGDAAIDAILEAIELAKMTDANSNRKTNPRHLLVHAQVMRKAQLKKAAQLGVSPSFFNIHTYYWGDWHQKILGGARASNISPLAWASQHGLRFSLHSDAPVTPMNPMMLMWSATSRQTSSGAVLGPNQRITRLEALKALTINPAWQNHLETTRGSISVGKFADFVVLSQNPLVATDVQSIEVLQTWVEGKRRYLAR